MSNGSSISSSVLDEHLALISINVGMFAGYRRATREQIVELGGSLPNSKAITEGSIKVFPNEALKDFATIKRGLFRRVTARGVKALGSRNVFALPREILEEIEQEIAAAEAEYEAKKVDLKANYETIFEAHVKANSEAESIIRSLKIDRATALSRLHFSSNVFRIVPFVREGESEEQGVTAIVQGLGRQLYEEVAAEMADLLGSDTLSGKKEPKAGQKTLRPIKAQRSKLQGLKFLDSTVEGAITLIDKTLSTLPKAGFIEDGPGDTPYSTLRRLVEVMADADDFVNAASKVKNGVAITDVLFPPKTLAPPPPPPAEPAATMVSAVKRPAMPSRPAAIPSRPGVRVGASAPFPKFPGTARPAARPAAVI